MIRLFAILAILFIVVPGNAQSLANVDGAVIIGEKLVNFSAADWSIYHDETQKSFFIDFETVDVNLSDIRVVNSAGEVIFEDVLLDLPVNTIYELDLQSYPKGDYKVEISTFTDLIAKEITLP